MERCAMTNSSGSCADKYAGFMSNGCFEEPSYTVRNTCAGTCTSAVERNVDNGYCPCRECDLSHADQLPLTMAYVPMQEWCNTYDTQTALCRGSLFPELCKPFAGSRGERYVR